MTNNAIPIAVPPWTTLGKKLESTVRKAIFDYQMLENVSHLAVALSGGKDSLSLLFLLKALSGRGFPPFSITAIHVSGEFSCGAQVSDSYLSSICHALDVPLIVKKSTKTVETLECYSCSRERRSLLFNAAKEAGIHTIAFGHHMDDNAETLLMNLLHKGEFAGQLPKIAMLAYDVTIIRPLIYVQEAEIREFAKLYGFARITCCCPVGQRSLRKKTDDLLEQMEALYPNARANIANASLVYGSTKATRSSTPCQQNKKAVSSAKELNSPLPVLMNFPSNG
jgi:tRNA 2-thiocytidine biosynthesis protein TtcA